MVSEAKYWNTWDPEDFVRMQHIPTGFQIVPGGYSENENSYTTFVYDDVRTRLFEHEKDGKYCRMHVCHGPAEFDIEYLKTDPWTVVLRMTNTKEPAEWSLRYNMLISFGFDRGEGRMQLEKPDSRFRLRTDDLCERLSGRLGDLNLGFAFASDPYSEVIAQDCEQAGRIMEGNGFKYTGGDLPDENRWVTCKFVLEESPQVCLCVSVGHDLAAARKKAAEALKDALENWDARRDEALSEESVSSGTAYPGMIEAIRDLINWNDVYAPQLHRAYTTISRHWTAEFGGWFLFFSDMCYQAMMKSTLGDYEMASRDLDYALSTINPEGNFSGMVCGHQNWSDRVQPPVLAYAAWTYYQYSGDLSALQKVYPSLRRAQKWYRENRMQAHPDLVQLGTSGTGTGDYRGTKTAAKNEAAMDNSPMYDDAHFDRESGLLDLYDIGASAQLCLDLQCTALIADALSRHTEAARIREEAQRMADAMNVILWDEARGMYANRHTDAGGAFGIVSPTSFYPLAAGAPDEARLDASIQSMFDPDIFFTPMPLIAVDAREPSAKENKYWRGRTWAPQTFWSYIGLRRYGREEEAHRLAGAAMKYFSEHWNAERHAFENYNPFTGEGADSVDSQAFYSWTGLLPLMWTMEQFGVDPWNGLCIGLSGGGDFAQKRRYFRGHRFDVTGRGDSLEICRDDKRILSSDLAARLRRFVWEPHWKEMTFTCKKSGSLLLYADDPENVIVRINEKPAAFHAEDGRIRLDFAPGTYTVRLQD